MLSLLFYKAINIIFSGVSIPTIIILSVAVLISAFNAYKSLSFFYENISLLLTSLLTSLIKYITGFRLIVLLYISIL